MSTPKICLVIDVEATCWEHDAQGNFTDQQKRDSEIIEFGLTVIELDKKTIVESRAIIVRPTTSAISPFCTALTTLTPAYVDEHGYSFRKALELLEKQYRCDRNMWASWGCYDRDIILRQCLREQVANPFNNNHLNVKSLFCWKHGFSCGLGKAVEHLGIPFDGTAHRGIDDSKNIAKVLLTL
jgi:inhibitor of KinA sporulation pathway (predicted exonuclease)